MIASKECPWSSSERPQIKLSLKLRRRPRWQSSLDKKWIAKWTNKIDKKKSTTRSRWQYDTDVINQIKRIWLKKYDKGWLANVDSHGIDKEKRDKYGYGCSEELKLTYKFEWEFFFATPRSRDWSSRGKRSGGSKKTNLYKGLIPC
jgi:hypothetical protein